MGAQGAAGGGLGGLFFVTCDHTASAYPFTQHALKLNTVRVSIIRRSDVGSPCLSPRYGLIGVGGGGGGIERCHALNCTRS